MPLFLMFLLLFVYRQKSEETENFEISVEPNNDESSMLISWKNYNSAEKIFKVYSSKDNKTYTQIPVDYSTVNTVRCLQIYPCPEASNQLQNWAVDSGYGQGKISIDSVYIDDFNLNPSYYLRSGTEWKYDVIFFGTWDSNKAKDISETAYENVSDFINEGRGVIFGHDTVKFDRDYFSKFSNILGITLYNMSVNQAEAFVSNKVTLVSSGLISKYPNDLGPVGTKFNIPRTHTGGQILNDISNVNFYLDCKGYETNKNESFYLTINKNVAMIQTGHTSGYATKDEQKILSNVIFYCNQLIVGNQENIDRNAIDITPPNAPSITFNGNEYIINTTDHGTKYYYYVESYLKENLDELYQKSTIGYNTIISDISHYLYRIDQYVTKRYESVEAWETLNITEAKSTSKDTTKDATATITTKQIAHKLNQHTRKYLHIIAIDKSGNMSPITTVEIGIRCTINKHKSNLLKSLYCIMLFTTKA